MMVLCLKKKENTSYTERKYTELHFYFIWENAKWMKVVHLIIIIIHVSTLIYLFIL